jgi:hypothetical protein
MSEIIVIKMKLYPGVKGWNYRKQDGAYLINDEITNWFSEQGLTLRMQRYKQPFELEDNEWGYGWSHSTTFDKTGKYEPKFGVFWLKSQQVAMMFKLSWI